ncbi:Ppx/GppA phosphatase family protein [uncultured Nitrospira sp.]|uniref:Ppx/GppA phosphatase family protein n=1 Tax=uncultured Nitrospira sp. TaxID=157176 RepID=UPI0031406736
MQRLAVIDIGTNSIHMVLAEIDKGFSYKIVDRIKEMARLGDGTFTSHRLSPEAMDRGLTVLKRFSMLATNKGFDLILPTATSAVREAKNGGDFLKLVRKELGLRVRVITGEEEARLIYLGVRNSMDLSKFPAMIVDIGGGSVELMACTQKRLQFVRSLKLGAIRLKDQFLKSDPPDKKMIQRVERLVSQTLKKSLSKKRFTHCQQLVATSGMAGNLAEIIYLARTGRPLPQIDMATIEIDEVREVEGLLRTKDTQTRLKIPGLDPRRVDTLYPGVLMLRLLMERLGVKQVRLSDKAIREGVIYDFIQQHQEGLRAEQEIPHVRRRQVLLLARRYQYAKVHAHHVAKLALSLFDQTRSMHHFGEKEREWLEYAALLHDIGHHIRENKHHKHTYYLITHADLPGFSSEELSIISNVARYHRRGQPNPKHKGYRLLDRDQRRVVSSLSAILRIADGLDRSHFSVVKKIHIEPGESLCLHVSFRYDPELELWTTERRKKFFEKFFHCRIALKAAGVASKNVA